MGQLPPAVEVEGHDVGLGIAPSHERLGVLRRVLAGDGARGGRTDKLDGGIDGAQPGCRRVPHGHVLVHREPAPDLVVRAGHAPVVGLVPDVPVLDAVPCAAGVHDGAAVLGHEGAQVVVGEDPPEVLGVLAPGGVARPIRRAVPEPLRGEVVHHRTGAADDRRLDPPVQNLETPLPPVQAGGPAWRVGVDVRGDTHEPVAHVAEAISRLRAGPSPIEVDEMRGELGAHRADGDGGVDGDADGRRCLGQYRRQEEDETDDGHARKQQDLEKVLLARFNVDYRIIGNIGKANQFFLR
ncbi:MAG: hypothetical protein DDT19_02255 [Syntrophomonadaceae bacterium]|nr:hypothetical protein [Bacillota bacterium]